MHVCDPSLLDAPLGICMPVCETVAALWEDLRAEVCDRLSLCTDDRDVRGLVAGSAAVIAIEDGEVRKEPTRAMRRTCINLTGQRLREGGA